MEALEDIEVPHIDDEKIAHGAQMKILCIDREPVDDEVVQVSVHDGPVWWIAAMQPVCVVS